VPTPSFTTNWDDADPLSEEILDDFSDSIVAFLTVTKLDSDNIQDGGIDEDALASSSVTTTKIANGAVNNNKLATEIQWPAGMIAPFGGTAAPTGWLMCDGSAVSRTTYAALFTVIGEAFGQGDNATTFNVPDFRGRFLRGVDSGQARDPDAASRTAMNTGGNTGDAVGSIQADAFDSHTHTQDAHEHTLTKNGNGGSTNTGITRADGTPLSFNSNNDGLPFHTVTATATNQNTGGNETRPINANVNFIIRT
jgi:microcystin-dependent protein